MKKKFVLMIVILIAVSFTINAVSMDSIANENGPGTDRAKVEFCNETKIFQTNISMSGLCQIQVKGNTSDVSICCTGKNIYNGKFTNGYIYSASKEALCSPTSKAFKTTQWIPATAGQYLTVSGSGVNRTIWQCKSADNQLYAYNNAATVQVPYGMSWVRVYFANNISGDVQIEYGSASTGFEPYKENMINLPALGAADSMYQDQEQRWYKNGVEEPENTIGSLLCYEGISTFFVSGNDIGKLTVRYPIVSVGIGKQYGVRWSLTNLSAKCERLEDAVGLVANSTEGNLPVANHFDYIYPWSDIRLCAIDANDHIVYQGEDGFAVDGSAGNVFVELPKWYVKRYQDSMDEYLYISREQLPGYEVEPAFIEGNQVLDKIYVGVYDGYVTPDQKMVSWSGQYPTTNMTLANYREFARANGSKRYGVIDIRTVIALQHLYLVEFANKDSGKTVGMGIQKLQYPYYKPAVVSESNTNRIILPNGKATAFKVGQPCGISEKGQYLMEHRIVLSIASYDSLNKAVYFSGDPYSVNAGTTHIYNTPMYSGMCDRMASPTGIAFTPINGIGFTSVRYHYLENLWGNIWNCVDGIVVKRRAPAICFDMTKYVSAGSDDYKSLSYIMPVQMENSNSSTYTNQMIKNLGFDPEYPAFGFPIEVGGGADKDNSFNDSWFGGTAVLREIRWKGAWDLGVGATDRAGLFCLRAWFGVDSTYWHDGARLIYKPIDLM